MRGMVSVIVGLILAWLPSPSAAESIDEVHRMLDGIENAWARHDLAALDSYCHPDLLTIISRPGTPEGAFVLKRDQVLAQIAKSWGNVVSHQFVEREIQVQNGIAWMQLTVADRTADRSSRLSHVLNAAIKVGPAWKMCFSMPRISQAVQVVEDLPTDSSAGQAGLRPGDVVASVASQAAPGRIASQPSTSASSGKQEVVVRRKSEELRFGVYGWPGGVQLSERLIPFGTAVFVGADAVHPVKDRFVDGFRGYVTGDLDRALQWVCPAGFRAFRTAGEKGAAVLVDAKGWRAWLEETVRGESQDIRSCHDAADRDRYDRCR